MLNLSPLSTFYLPLLSSFLPLLHHLLSPPSPLFSPASPLPLFPLTLFSPPLPSPSSFSFLSIPLHTCRSGSYRLGSVYVGLSVHIQRVLHLYSSHETVASFLVAPTIRLSGWCECSLVTVEALRYVCIDKLLKKCFGKCVTVIWIWGESECGRWKKGFTTYTIYVYVCTYTCVCIFLTHLTPSHPLTHPHTFSCTSHTLPHTFHVPHTSCTHTPSQPSLPHNPHTLTPSHTHTLTRLPFTYLQDSWSQVRKDSERVQGPHLICEHGCLPS